jgi:Fe2+ transport system protein FeoA
VEQYIHLSDVMPKNKAKVKAIIAENNLKRKLLDMGIIPGVMIEVIKLAPLGDPVEIKVRGYHLSLRKEEARCVTVEVTG